MLKLKTYCFPSEKNEGFNPTETLFVVFVKGPAGSSVTLLLLIASVAFTLKVQFTV